MLRFDMNAVNIRIRKADRKDREALATFQQHLASETESKTLDRDIVLKGVDGIFDSDRKGFYIVAEIEDAVVGSLLITYEWSDWRNAEFWWIQSVYVDAKLRRKGVYKAMYNHVHTISKSDPNICGIRLYVERDNHIAQIVYTDLGMSKSRYDLFEIDT